MKTRTGFVSNSSSSSFIVAVKRKAEKCPTCGRGDTNFLDEIEGATSDDSYVSDRGSVDVAVLLFATILSDESPEKKREIREKLKKYDTPEWELASIGISYHDKELQDRLFSGLKTGTIVEILNEEDM
jgi:hypothetical protein